MAIFSELNKIEKDKIKKDELEKDKSIEALKLLVEHLSEKYNLRTDEILNIIEKKNKIANERKIEDKKQENQIPLSVFANDKLSALEIIVKYLKENLCKSYHEIAILLNRNDRTIWATYNNSLRKQKTKLILYNFKESRFQNKFIPLSIFSKRDNSVLETIVIYLKDNFGFSFNDISLILLKDYQTIYTSYRKGIGRWKK